MQLFKEFIVAEHDIRHNRVIRVNKAGEIMNSYAIDRPLDPHFLNNGNLLLSANQAIVELDPQFQELWKFETKRLAFFSCQQNSKGNIIFGDASKATINEINRTGNLVRTMDFPFSHEPQNYLYDFRLIRTLPSDDLLVVACHNKKKLAKMAWSGEVTWEVDIEGAPYMPLVKPNGNILVSLGATGKIVEVTESKEIIWEYDMVKDSQLERGWIAGISILKNGNIVYSDSLYDRLIEISPVKELISRFQDRNTLLHPSTHIIIE